MSKHPIAAYAAQLPASHRDDFASFAIGSVRVHRDPVALLRAAERKFSAKRIAEQQQRAEREAQRAA